jgi:hypothetical protein
MYRDPQLRARLALKARDEHLPICWDVMKRRYLRLIEDLIDTARRSAPKKSQTAGVTVEVQ